jgi:hypothetical protein
MQSTRMIEGTLYECISQIRVRGHLEGGAPAWASIDPGTVAIAVRGPDGGESVLIDGVVIPYNWETFGWGRQFREVRDA